MKIEKSELELVISIKGTKGSGTTDNPVRAVRVYYTPSGTFIGEVNENTLSRANDVIANFFRKQGD